MCKTTMPFECYFIDFCPMEDLKHNLQINLEYWQQEESIAKEKAGKVSHVTWAEGLVSQHWLTSGSLVSNCTADTILVYLRGSRYDTLLQLLFWTTFDSVLESSRSVNIIQTICYMYFSWSMSYRHIHEVPFINFHFELFNWQQVIIALIKYWRDFTSLISYGNLKLYFMNKHWKNLQEPRLLLENQSNLIKFFYKF